MVWQSLSGKIAVFCFLGVFLKELLQECIRKDLACFPDIFLPICLETGLNHIFNKFFESNHSRFYVWYCLVGFFLEAVHPATWQFCFGCVKVEGCCRWCAGYNGNFDIAVRKKDIWRCNPGVQKSLPSLQSWVEQASKRRLAKEGVSLPPASKKPPAGTHRESFPSQKSPLFCQLFVRRFHL